MHVFIGVNKGGGGGSKEGQMPLQLLSQRIISLLLR